uniref:Uncharacterized protein n=1 Tax=Cucumis melo TaxID=3656 RepID=A0A9I9EM80_CUCME
MILHEDTGTLWFNFYELNPSNVKYDYLASCEIKVFEESVDHEINYQVHLYFNLIRLGHSYMYYS